MGENKPTLDTRSYNHVNILQEEIELLKSYATQITDNAKLVRDIETTTHMLHWHIEKIMKENGE